MTKKAFFLSFILMLSFILTGCFGFDLGKPPSGGGGNNSGDIVIQGQLFFADNTNRIPIANGRIDIPGEYNIIYVDKDGKFTLSKLVPGEYTIRAVAPIGVYEDTYKITKNTKELNIHIPIPSPKDFAWSTFCEVTNLEKGTKRWANDSIGYIYYVDKDDDPPTTKELQLLDEAVRDLSEGVDREWLDIFPVEKDENAQIIVSWKDLDDDYAVEVELLPPNTQEIRYAIITINKKYSEYPLPYYLGFGLALGLSQTYDPYSMMYVEIPNENFLKKRANEADLNYLRALYSMPIGYQNKCTPK